MKLLIVDTVGALFSAFFIGIVFRYFFPVTGLPDQVLIFLAVFPVFFAAFGLFIYFKARHLQSRALLILACLNTAYVILSAAVLFSFYSEITYFGWYYFISEILVVLLLVRNEFKAWKSDTD